MSAWGRIILAFGVTVGAAYIVGQCIAAAMRPGATEWTIGYWLFALMFAVLGAVGVRIMWVNGAD